MNEFLVHGVAVTVVGEPDAVVLFGDWHNLVGEGVSVCGICGSDDFACDLSHLIALSVTGAIMERCLDK